MVFSTYSLIIIHSFVSLLKGATAHYGGLNKYIYVFLKV